MKELGGTPDKSALEFPVCGCVGKVNGSWHIATNRRTDVECLMELFGLAFSD